MRPALDTTLTLRAKPDVFLVFGLMTGIPALIFLVETLRGVHGAFGALMLCVGAALYCGMWLGTYRLELSPDALRYRALFRGDRTIPLSEIQSTHLEYNNQRGRGRKTPNLRLVVVPRPDSAIRRFSINASVFPSAGIGRVAQWLEATPPDHDA